MPASSWIAHVKATRKKMGAGASYKSAMKKAASTWKKKAGKKK